MVTTASVNAVRAIKVELIMPILRTSHPAAREGQGSSSTRPIHCPGGICYRMKHAVRLKPFWSLEGLGRRGHLSATRPMARRVLEKLAVLKLFDSCDSTVNICPYPLGPRTRRK